MSYHSAIQEVTDYIQRRVRRGIQTALTPPQGKDPWLRDALFVTQHVTGPARHGIVQFLDKTARRVPFLSGGGTLLSSNYYSNKLRRTVTSGSIDLSEHPRLYLLRGMPVLLKSTKASGTTLSYPRGRFTPEFFAQQAIDHTPRDLEPASRFRVVSVGAEAASKLSKRKARRDTMQAGYDVPDDYGKMAQDIDAHLPPGVPRIYETGVGPEDLLEAAPCERVEDLVLTESAARAVRFARTWFAGRAEYEMRRIIWRCGMIFEGPPGTGKTALARALAYEMGLPIHVFHLSTMNSEMFETGWSLVAENSPSIVFFDDFDRVYEKGELVAKEGPAYDLILQALSGVKEMPGLMSILAVNDARKLDATIFDTTSTSRFGRRATLRARFEPPTAEQREILAQRILFDFSAEEVGRIVEEGSADSGKQFVDRCTAAVTDRLEARLFAA